MLFSKVHTLLRQSSTTLLWLLPALPLLGIARAAILFLPFRKIAPVLGHSAPIQPWVALLQPNQQAKALELGRAVRIAARYTPWVSNCFPQAMVGVWLLSLYRIPHALYFGLKRSDEGQGMDAHAWVASGPVHVTGSHSFDLYTVVGCYASSHFNNAPGFERRSNPET